MRQQVGDLGGGGRCKELLFPQNIPTTLFFILFYFFSGLKNNFFLRVLSGTYLYF